MHQKALTVNKTEYRKGRCKKDTNYENFFSVYKYKARGIESSLRDKYINHFILCSVNKEPEVYSYSQKYVNAVFCIHISPLLLIYDLTFF